jgi:hypothetical protein
MIPNSVWNIHAQVVAATMPGMTHGISVIERTIARPAKLWLRRIAVATPNTTWKTIEPATHQIVLMKAWVVTRGRSTAAKFL